MYERCVIATLVVILATVILIPFSVRIFTFITLYFSPYILDFHLYLLDQPLPCHSLASPQLFIVSLFLFPLFILLSLPQFNFLCRFLRTANFVMSVSLSVPTEKFGFRKKKEIRETFKQPCYKNSQENWEKDNRHVT